MWRLISSILALLCWLLAAAPVAHAEKRVALVIGNAKYQHEAHLNNPLNDAREVAAALKTYPSGHVDRGMRIRARVVVSGCSGSVVGHDHEPEFALFIPDKGCPGMMARWRRGGGPWNILGPMQNVR
jgi:hypothetical protein